MSVSDFSFAQSLLFPDALCLLAPPQADMPPEPTHAQNDAETPPQQATAPVAKSVRLLNGHTLQLVPRVRKKAVVDLTLDPDSILDMDALYDRVSQRQELQKHRQRLRDALEEQGAPQKPQKPRSSLLWADKYRPKTFLQICPAGNERQYRLVMHWLRRWGSVVFGAAKTDEFPLVDEMGRPAKKILLIHGPPGIGKTAVTHLLAHQMGYHVEELNAANSMDALQGADLEGSTRFANASAALRLRVKTAMTTNSITGRGRPTCLVVDEIDSAINTGDIVRVLADLVHQDAASSRKAALEQVKGKKKPFTLTRPIICIANDIYAQGLRGSGNPLEKLRPLCEIVAFRKPAAGSAHGTKINVLAQKSVKEFLADIAHSEKLGLDKKEIAEVFEVCDGDLRACINHLQFLSRKLDPDLHAAQNSVAATDLKTMAAMDSNLSWFSAVDAVFRRNQLLSKEENFTTMLDLFSSSGGKATGSAEKIVRGCFNRYLDVAYLQDNSPVRLAEISDWLHHHDSVFARSPDLSSYTSLVLLKFWSLFSDINLMKFQNQDSLLPNARNMDFECFETLKQNRAAARKIADSVPLEAKIAMGSSSAFYACEFIPFVDKMLSPEIGSAKSMASLKAHEAKNVEKLSLLVEKLDIKLETQRDLESNQTFLVFNPDMDGITSFSGSETLEQKRRSLNLKRNWLFPLLQSEIMARGEAKAAKRQRPTTPEAVAQKKKPRLTSSVNFFKNQYEEISNKIDTPVNKEATRIWVKHHEGFSNAVRKNIGWYELWH